MTRRQPCSTAAGDVVAEKAVAVLEVCREEAMIHSLDASTEYDGKRTTAIQGVSITVKRKG
jgi:hypothetical protein